jgi:hypothetical protein
MIIKNGKIFSIFHHLEDSNSQMNHKKKKNEIYKKEKKKSGILFVRLRFCFDVKRFLTENVFQLKIIIRFFLIF